MVPSQDCLIPCTVSPFLEGVDGVNPDELVERDAENVGKVNGLGQSQFAPVAVPFYMAHGLLVPLVPTLTHGRSGLILSDAAECTYGR